MNLQYILTRYRRLTIVLSMAASGLLAEPLAAETVSERDPKKDGARIEALLAKEDLPGVTREISLVEALELTDSRNLTLAVIRTELKAAEIKIKQAWAAMMPVAQGHIQYVRADHADTVSMGGLTGGPGGSIEINPANTVTGGISVNLPLVNANLWKGLEMAKTGAELAALTVEEQRRTVLFGTAQAYYTALMSRSLVSLYKEQIRATVHHVTVAEKKLAAGSGLRIDVLRAGIELEKAEKALSNAKLTLATACDALGTLTGLDTLVLPKSEERLSFSATNENALTQKAEKSRVDLDLQRKNLKLAEQQIDAAWFKLLPSLSLAWQGTYKFTSPGDMGDTDRSRWNLMLNLTVPLFNCSDIVRISEGKVAQRKAALQLESLTQDIGQNVRQAYREYQTALTDVESAKRQFVLAEESLKLSEAAFAAGAGTSLEVTDASRTQIEAGVNVLTSELKSQLALLNLLQIIGAEPLKTAGELKTVQ